MFNDLKKVLDNLFPVDIKKSDSRPGDGPEEMRYAEIRFNRRVQTIVFCSAMIGGAVYGVYYFFKNFVTIKDINMSSQTAVDRIDDLRYKLSGTPGQLIALQGSIDKLNEKLDNLTVKVSDLGRSTTKPEQLTSLREILLTEIDKMKLTLQEIKLKKR